MDADGGNERRLTAEGDCNGDLWPAWSPDGKTIAYGRYADKANRLFTVNADGTNPRPLTPGPGHHMYPSWSKDGTRILYLRTSGDRTGHLVAMRPDGTNPVALVDVSAPTGYLHGNRPAWRPR